MLTLSFLFTAFVIVATPGTGAIYSIGAGLAQGKKAGLWAAFACTLGIVPHLIMAITGLAAIMHTSALAFNVLKYLGVAYLLYMAWGMWQNKGSLTLDSKVQAGRRLDMIKTGIAINLLNPKLTIFFFAFLPQFISNDSERLSQMLILSAVFMLMTFVVFAIYGGFAGAMRTLLLSSSKRVQWIQRAFALSFVAMSVKLAMTSADK